MKLKITSPESLESVIADAVRQRILLTKLKAALDSEIAQVSKLRQPRITEVNDQIAALEAEVQAYCTANRAALFPEKKSRETNLAEFGFETTPPRVETANKKIKWKDVLSRLLRLSWGAAYTRNPESTVDKQALLADRSTLTPEQLQAAGIQFCQDEQFFIRPKPATARDLVPNP